LISINRKIYFFTYLLHAFFIILGASMMKKMVLEQGQAMVIFVLGLVVLLGFASLAIDGGMAYSDRRYDQSAADTAALAGAGAIMNQFMTQPSSQNFTCAGYTTLGNIGVLAAQQSAVANKFTIASQDLGSANHGVQVLCGTDSTGKYLDIWVKITSLTKTSFAQIFARNDIQSTVEAKVRARPPVIAPQAVLGNAIISLNETAACGDGGGIDRGGHGNGAITVDGGIYSYSCIDGHTDELTASGIIALQNISGDFTSFAPQSSGSSNYLPKPVFPADNCAAYSGGYGNPVFDAQGHLQPGKYASFEAIGDAILNPGLYCFWAGADPVHTCVRGEDVTIVLVSGGYKQNGDAACLNLSAWHKTSPNEQWTDRYPGNTSPAPIPGVVWYMPESNKNAMEFRGNADSVFHGTVYVPGGSIGPGGNSIAFGIPSTQYIAYNIDFKGTTGLNITWADDLNDTGTLQNASLDMLK
jgi:hypothetical protein